MTSTTLLAHHDFIDNIVAKNEWRIMTFSSNRIDIEIPCLTKRGYQVPTLTIMHPITNVPKYAVYIVLHGDNDICLTEPGIIHPSNNTKTCVKDAIAWIIHNIIR